MGIVNWPDVLLAILLVAPATLFGAIGLAWLAGMPLGERAITRANALIALVMVATVAGLWWARVTAGHDVVVASLGEWFAVGHYEFPITLVADRLSLPLLTLTVVLAGVIGRFSQTYLHRERGFARFFALLSLFTVGALLVFAAGSLDLLVAGWELVGLTSVLLIAFFHDRPEPVDGALRVFGVYRAADIGLLVTVVLCHQWAGSAALTAGGPALDGRAATVVGLLLLVAAAGKSAQVPFSGWLPRAMEGPTPSSAIFYGALSVHMGAYLLLRLQPTLVRSPLACMAIVTVGALTAIHGTLAGRAAADAKTSLAHAALTQVGVIFMEIGLGFPRLALLHICGHALVRTLQFLRAPSMLHDHHQMHAAAGGHLTATGSHFAQWVPAGLQRWSYRLAVDRSHLDTLLDRLVLEPLHAMSSLLGRIDEWTGRPPTMTTEVPPFPVGDVATSAGPDVALHARATERFDG